MYGLDESTDVEFLRGRELVQVCVGRYQVVLGFTDDLSITLESKFRLVDAGGATAEISADQPQSSKYLVDLLGASIDRARVEAVGALSMGFSDGTTLTLLDSNEDSESYTIVAPDVDIVV